MWITQIYFLPNNCQTTAPIGPFDGFFPRVAMLVNVTRKLKGPRETSRPVERAPGRKSADLRRGPRLIRRPPGGAT